MLKIVALIIGFFINNIYAVSIHEFNDNENNEYLKVKKLSNEEKMLIKKEILLLPPEESIKEIKKNEYYFIETEDFFDKEHVEVQ